MISETLLQAARDLADHLNADIQSASTREAHIRSTQRANEALALLNGLLSETEHVPTPTV